MNIKSLITESVIIDSMFDMESEMLSIKEAILEQLIIEGVYDPGILKCVFLAGGPGSGKSYTAKEVFGVGKNETASFAASGLKLVNSDSSFEALLKKNGINPKDLAKIEAENPQLWDMITKEPDGIRGQAKKITKQQQAFYEAGRLGMIIDGTGDEVLKIKNKKNDAEDLGYDTFMIFVNTSLEVALKRNAERDRTLPEKLVTQIWKDCQNNLGKFQSMFSGNFIIVDNTIYGPVHSNIQKAVNQFINKPIYNPIGKKWMSNALALKSSGFIK